MIQRNIKPSSQQSDRLGLVLQRSNGTTTDNSSQDCDGQPQHAPFMQAGGKHHDRNGSVNGFDSTSCCSTIISRSFTNPCFIYVITLCVFMILVFSNTTYMNKDESSNTNFRGGESSSTSSKDDDSLQLLFELAKRDSFGLLDDIPNESWERMKHRVNIERINHKEPNNPTHGANIPKMWYQENFEPDFSCPHERRIGGMGDGGKWVCNPHRLVDMGRTRQTPGCLIYSIGSDGNLMFEAGMADFLLLLQGNTTTVADDDSSFCEIHIFDPSPNYSNMVPEKYKHFMFYHPWGLKASSDQDTKKDGSANTITGLPAPAAITRQEQSYQIQQQQRFITLGETVEKLGHANRTIDIFKIDCENCEWTTYQDWLSPELDIRQMLVEVHNVPIPHAINFFTDLQKAGYVTFHKEPNTQYADGNCQEYCFLRLDKPFFS